MVLALEAEAAFPTAVATGLIDRGAGLDADRVQNQSRATVQIEVHKILYIHAPRYLW
jgi:hypothetical protein